jgi:hypothetical protein
MRPNDHVAITGYVDFTPLTIKKLITIGEAELGYMPGDEEWVPDFVATCDECGDPVTYPPLVSDEHEFEDPADWIRAVKTAHYVNNVGLRANGYDAYIPLRWREEDARQ